MKTPQYVLIQDYGEFYGITPNGVILSFWNRGQKSKREIPKRLKQTDNGTGYKIVSLSKNGRRKNHYVHRLMALHFISGFGENVAHKNGNRSDNRVQNLMWCSKSENESHKKNHGTLLFGSKAPWAKLTECKVKEIRAKYKNGEKTQRIADLFAVSQATIRKIVLYKSWQHV